MSDKLIYFELEQIEGAIAKLKDAYEIERIHVKHSLTELFNMKRELIALRKEKIEFMKRWDLDEDDTIYQGEIYE